MFFKIFKKSSAKKITPNKLTILRIFLLPLPCALLMLSSSGAKVAAVSIGSLLGVTDYFDGVLARKYKKITPLGTLLDPVADKIFVTSVYLTLVYLKYFPFLPVALLIIREIIVSFLRSWFPEETKVIRITRLKTLFQMSFAGLAILIKIYLLPYFHLTLYFLWFLVFFSYFSAIPYFYRVFKAVKKFKKNLKHFFYSFSFLGYPLFLIFTFPFTGKLFWINILALNFYIFRKGLAKSCPELAQKETLFVFFIMFVTLFELIYFQRLLFSMWIILIFSLLRDGIKSLKFMWKVLILQ